jgi:hypothetical protein
MSYVATLVYELHPDTPPETRKLLRAHLVGRRWQDRCEGALMPANSLWMRRPPGPAGTPDEAHAGCAQDLRDAAAAVAQMGREVRVVRAWIQVSGAGTYGLARIAPPSGG